jgi:hypothetical protein
MKEVEFGYRIRQALNEGAERLDYRTTFRLEQARKAALSHQKRSQESAVWVPALQVAAAGGAPSNGEVSGLWVWLHRMGLVAPLLVLIVGFVGIYEWQRTQAIAEMANLDFAVLMDETPLEAYADQGFTVLLKNEQQL